ncbi:unnamed protein product [Protopolystoma xenopodis]|uniref:Uncharacterized protein n=1 Tax=Protopolystoma xenopodis TaxID=117903 RepID=A0A3S4ZP92_9PLAT|nr:unnamed protein product [Protopolystoma xenopodis]
MLDPNTPVQSMRLLVRAANFASASLEGTPMPSSSAISTPTVPPVTWSEVLGSMRVDASQLTHPHYQLLQMDGLINNELDLQCAMIPENIAIAI